MPAGYSGTPLPRKLGIKDGDTFATVNAPSGFLETLGELPTGVSRSPLSSNNRVDVILHFARSRADIAALSRTVARMESDASVWVCWAKKSSPLAVADVDEAIVRASGLAAGVVDIKIAAIDEDWSGLKFMFRLKDRPRIRSKKK